MLAFRSNLLTRTLRNLVLLTVILGPFEPQGVHAQETSVVHHFIGVWEGHGELFGSDAAFSMEWEWVLDERFVRLTFQNSVAGRDGTEGTLEAQAFYRPIGAAEFEGTWFDSRGVSLPLTGSVENATLTSLWGSPETEQGRTVYRLLHEDQLEVEDFVLRGGEWHQFGHAIHTRLAETLSEKPR